MVNTHTHTHTTPKCRPTYNNTHLYRRRRSFNYLTIGFGVWYAERHTFSRRSAIGDLRIIHTYPRGRQVVARVVRRRRGSPGCNNNSNTNSNNTIVKSFPRSRTRRLTPSWFPVNQCSVEYNDGLTSYYIHYLYSNNYEYCIWVIS